MNDAEAIAEIRKIVGTNDEYSQILSVLDQIGPETDILGRRVEDSSMWINAFKLIRPSEEFVADIGREVIRQLKVPGITILRIAAT